MRERMAEVDRAVGALTDAGNRDDPFLSFSFITKSIVRTVQRAGRINKLHESNFWFHERGWPTSIFMIS